MVPTELELLDEPAGEATLPGSFTNELGVGDLVVDVEAVLEVEGVGVGSLLASNGRGMDGAWMHRIDSSDTSGIINCSTKIIDWVNT